MTKLIYKILFMVSMAVAIAGAMTSVHVQAKTLEWQDLRDWSVSCSDKRYCVALTFGKSKKGDKVTFKLERGNKPGSKIYVTTKPKDYILQKGMEVRVSVVGHDYSFFGDVTKVYKGNEMAFVEPFNAKTIKKLREGRFGKIDVHFGGNIGTISYDISLQGVSSALAMMDIVQGRLDREDAAVVSGGEAQSLISNYDFSSAKAPPVQAEAKNQQRDPEENIEYPDDDTPDQNTLAATAEQNEESGLGIADIIYETSKINDRVLILGYRVLQCQLPDAVEAFGARSINLEPGLFLHLVPCHMADLNIPYYAVLENSGKFDLLEFQHSSIEEGANPSLVVNAEWNKKAGTLNGYQYYAQSQDCGSHEVHRFAVEENKFYLSEFRQKKKCDGVTSPPQKYPILWNGEGD